MKRMSNIFKMSRSRTLCGRQAKLNIIKCSDGVNPYNIDKINNEIKYNF